ncbi:MAG: hypothetical protein ACE5MI_08565, partial [Acidimicrobiia bacterium]
MTSSPRRRRRRWWLLLLVALAVGVVAAAISLRSDTREIVAFLDRADLVAGAEQARAEAFQELVRRDLNRIDRESLMA